MSTSLSQAIDAGVESLPALSANAIELLNLARSDTATSADLEAVLRRDPAMTANVLRMVNSPRFCGRGRIASVRDAVARLGMCRLAEFAIAASVNSMMDTDVPGYEIPAGRLFPHAVGTAIAAENLARRVGGLAAEEAYTAALLHDVGKLVLGQFVEQQVDLGVVLHAGVAFDAAEREQLATDHAEVGARLLERWGLPENVVRAVRWHHCPLQLDPPDTMTDVIHVADTMAMMVGLNEGREGLCYNMHPEVLMRLGLDDDDLQEVTLDLVEGVNELT